ncbi:protein kinase [uncultured Algibacter sp.]|uniref:protein kinase domain-containing protein n=1 Tax=uncultured Algibacter sp. TaxID=298659 RepID=UPI00260CF985|nr:protein kinase [uncultured Algibacter sp.]
MDENFNFYELDAESKKGVLEDYYGRGECILQTSGMCGEIFVFDQGVNTTPRYSCIKLPKPIGNTSKEEIERRFIRELELQLSFYYNKYVHWAFDFDSVFNVPVASFRYWGNDLNNLIERNQPSQVTKLSLLIYTCIGLKHCYDKGLIAHQDLKPANIFIQNIKNDFVGLPDLDIYDFVKIADFGLANAFKDYNFFGGSRPYMAPEQWNENQLSQATDIFALGVIFFELITNGHHPVGIKLRDFWPIPKNENSKKWTRPAGWKKWIEDGCEIVLSEDITVDKESLVFIKKMLNVNPLQRPSIDDTLDFLLNQLKNICGKSHSQVEFLIVHFEKQSSQFVNLETDWPYLYKKWNEFKKTYE